MSDSLTTREVADRLGIKPRSVAWLIRRGLIAATWNVYARRFEVELDEVERYARERRPQHRPATPNE
jgi:Mn-dependent DtxR family transcriptional regulator